MSLALGREVLRIEAAGILAVRKRLGDEFVQAVDRIMACPSRLVVTGIGKSGIIGQKIAATLNSTGTPAFFLHPVEAMHGDLGMVAATDLVLAISYSGETSELNRLLTSLRQRAISVIALCGRRDSTLAKLADILLDAAISQEACPLGLAPTTSTTAALALGDALAVALLERKKFGAEDFRRNHPGGSLGARLKVAISEVMLSSTQAPLVCEDASLAEAIVELNQKNLGAVFICDAAGKLTGILTDGDLRRLLSASNLRLEAQVLSQVMTSSPLCIECALLAADALSLMQEHEITVLAVVDEQRRFVGVVHLHNLLGKGEFRFLI